jgi:hypothetical protein
VARREGVADSNHVKKPEYDMRESYPDRMNNIIIVVNVDADEKRCPSGIHGLA